MHVFLASIISYVLHPIESIHATDVYIIHTCLLVNFEPYRAIMVIINANVALLGSTMQRFVVIFAKIFETDLLYGSTRL